MQCSNIDMAGCCTIGPCGGGDQCIPAAQFDDSYSAEPAPEGHAPPPCPDGKCNECGCKECEAAAGQ